MTRPLAALFFQIFLFLGSAAASDVYIQLAGQRQDERVAVALPPILAASLQLSEAALPRDSSRPAATLARGDEVLLARHIQEILRSDLLLSRYVNLLEQGPMFGGSNLWEIAPKWKKLGAEWIALGRAGLAADKVSLVLRLDNLTSGETRFQRTYVQHAVHLRSLVHRAADDLIQALTGKPGIAHTRIAFVNDASGSKEIYVADYDGANARQATSERSLALLPRFAPNARHIAYTSYREGNPDLFLLDLENGVSRPVSQRQGLNLPGGFSPDGSQLLVTLSAQKNPNIYMMNLADGSIARLTQHDGVDSTPTFSPDSREVAFISDRMGNPQIYILHTVTHKTRSLTKTMNWCDSPAWSPTGEWIAFAGRLHVKDKMDIFLADVTGSQLRQLTRGEGSNEDPAWSLDGRFIVFTSTRRGRRELFLMDADGSAPRLLAEIPGSSYTPTWSQ